MNKNFLRSPNLEDEEQIDLLATNPIEEQQAPFSPIPDEGVIADEMQAAQEIENESQDLIAQQQEPSRLDVLKSLATQYSSRRPATTNDELKVLQEDAAKKDRIAMFTKIADRLATAYGNRHGGKAQGNADLIDMISQQGHQAVKDYKTRQANEGDSMKLDLQASLRDSGSNVSKLKSLLAKRQALKMGLSEEEASMIGDMSADELAALKLGDPSASMGRKGFTTIQGFVTPQGLPIMRNEADGKMYDVAGNPYDPALQGKPVYLYDKMVKGTMGENFSYNALSGMKNLDSETNPSVGLPQGTIRTAETHTKALDQKYEKEGLDAFPNLKAPVVREAVQKEQTELSGLTKNYTDQNTAARKLDEVLKGNNKLALSVVKTQMPRLSGEVGNLNQTEQEMWQGSQAALDKAIQYVTRVGTSELTPENKKELKELLDIYKKTAEDAYNNILNRRAMSLGTTYNVPPKYFKEIYGTPFTKSTGASGLSAEERRKKIEENKKKLEEINKKLGVK
jgi:hypothetical protein